MTQGLHWAGISFRVAGEEDVAEMALLLGDVFSRKDPPAVASEFSATKLERIATVFGNKSVKERLSIVAVSASSGRIIGAALSHDFATQLPDEIAQIDLEGEPVIALLDDLEDTYRQSHDIIAGKFLHIFMIAVCDEYNGRGIAQSMVRSSLNNAREIGFTMAFTEATNRTSQRVFANNGFEKICVSNYQEFEFQGQRPFTIISDQPGCALMEVKLI